jgi:hypothetical protein
MRRAFSTVHYGILLFKYVGAKAFLRELMRQIFSTTTYVCIQTNLDTDIAPVQSKIAYSLRPASGKDMEEVFQKIETESKEGASELIGRKRFYESGLRNAFVARTADTNELCYVQWVLTSKEYGLASRRLKSIFPSLKDDEIMLENRYTFEKYRGNRIAASVDTQLCEMAKRNGYKRMVAYTPQDNMASLKAAETAGHREFQRIRVDKHLFFSRRKLVAIKPVPNAVSGDSTSSVSG